jgi:hypothetical protein
MLEAKIVMKVAGQMFLHAEHQGPFCFRARWFRLRAAGLGRLREIALLAIFCQRFFRGTFCFDQSTSCFGAKFGIEVARRQRTKLGGREAHRAIASSLSTQKCNRRAAEEDAENSVIKIADSAFFSATSATRRLHLFRLIKNAIALAKRSKSRSNR